MSFPFPPRPLELWGGPECTINRVGDNYFDQLERTGHTSRLDDLSRFAELGIRTLRYPLQWERIAPDGLASADWQWADQRLAELRSLGIRLIVGLVHHGSGPRHTSLIDPAFAEGLARFAEAVAQRYPWVDAYTPVNEPLTTARFSGLYGHWYPHGRDYATFVQALLIQCRATVLAMRAIRSIHPSAQLIQTEDVGKVFSTPLLSYQAQHENERRWLSFDLLCGRLNRDHPLWHDLARVSNEAELEWFLEHPCPPDILGINYYVTSERFLDENLEGYPAHYHGGNGRHSYADAELVRVNTEQSFPVGFYERLREVWERYRLPIAITEAHLGSSREEQLRWLVEGWNAAQTLRDEGADIRALTVWSLLGAYDWCNLVRFATNFYEPGAFDIRGDSPRPTALARVIRALASGSPPTHPVLAQPGWWHRPDRFLYPFDKSSQKLHLKFSYEQGSTQQVHPLLITNAKGILGRAFTRICEYRGLSYSCLNQEETHGANTHSLHGTLTQLQPWAVVSTTDFSYPGDISDREAEHWYSEQIAWLTALANACFRLNLPFVFFSSDTVFDGNRTTPYVEDDPVSPASLIGRAQVGMEQRIVHQHPKTLLIRSGPLLSPWEDAPATVQRLHFLLSRTFPDYEVLISPGYVPDLVHVSLDLLIDEERGIRHLPSAGMLSLSTLIDRLAQTVDSAEMNVLKQSIRRSDHAPSSARCRALSSKRGQLLPELDDALARYTRDVGRG